MPAVVPIMIGLGVAGTVTSVVGQVKAGNAAKKAGEASQAAAESVAELSEYNAAVASLQAQDAIQRGAEEEARFRTGVKLLIGSQRADIAANNVDVNFGSAVDVQADAAFLGEMDALTIRVNAAREAWGYEVQAEDYRRQAEIQRKEGGAAAVAGRAQQSAYRWGAAGSVLGGAVSAGGMLAQRYGWGSRPAGGGAGGFTLN
jgi:hypothetical protein